jgi:hypothetical protein
MLKKWFSIFFVRRSAFLTVMLVCILLSQVSCLSSCQELRERRNKAEADLDDICKNIPIPNDFIAVSSDKSLDIEKVAIFRRFKSNASCEVARKHFFTYFIDKGWNREQMKVEQTRGGMESLDFIFRNDDRVVWVACQNDVDDEAEKQIVVSCSWGLR